MEKQTIETVYNENYTPGIIRMGRLTGWLAILFSFAPALTLLVVFDTIPPVSAMIAGFVSIASTIGVLWVIEPVSYFPIVGVAGTYMAFCTGNISNLRIPCATVAQKVADVEPGTPEGNIVATLGMAVSVLSNIAVLTVGVILGTTLLNMLPQNVMDALGYLLPALYGALFVQFASSKIRLAPFGLGIGLGLYFLVSQGILPFWTTTLGAVVGTIAIAVLMHKSSQGKQADA